MLGSRLQEAGWKIRCLLLGQLGKRGVFLKAGMLEVPSLLLLPAPQGASIVEPGSGREVGSARWVRPGGGFLFWRPRPILEVRESDDEPLLCQIRRRGLGGQRWEVIDAEEQPVGVINRNRILNDEGVLIGAAVWSAGRLSAVLSDLRGEELATLIRQPQGLLITFKAAREGNPFLKMLLLALGLAQIL